MIKHREASAREISVLGLNHRVYLPENIESPRAAIVLVHGRAGSARSMWPFSRVFREQNVIAVAPEAPLDDPIGGKSWWHIEEREPGDSSPDPRKPTQAAPLQAAIDKLDFFVSELPGVYPVDAERVFALGFSQGAAMVASLSLRRPGIFQAVGLLAGFVPQVVFDKSEQFLDAEIRTDSSMLPQYFMASGTKDEAIPFHKAERSRDNLRRLGAAVQFCSEDVGHKVGAQCMRELISWFKDASSSV